MQVSLKKVIQFFEGLRQNVIPPFDRPYVWEKKEWQRLWDDFIRCWPEENQPERIHFLGTIVTKPIKSTTQVKKYWIIDGQQRLITIALLLLAMRMFSECCMSEDVNQYLSNSQISFFSDANNADDFKLLTSSFDHCDFSFLVCGLPEPDRNKMGMAVMYFRKLIQQSHIAVLGPGGLLDLLKNCLIVTSIELSEDDDPLMVFERLNLPGQSWTAIDYMRNFALAKFEKGAGGGISQEEVYKNIWAEMVAILGQNLFEFFRQYLKISEEQDIFEEDVCGVFLKRFDGFSGPEMLAELKHCLTLCGFFKRFLNPEIEVDQRVRAILLSLKELGYSAPYPLMLCIFSAHAKQQITHEDLINLLAFIESISLRTVVFKYQGCFQSIANKFLVTGEKKTADYLFELLERNCPSDEAVIDQLESTIDFDMDLARFILIKIELMLGTKQSEVHENIQIERILCPLRPFGSWMLKFGNMALSEKEGLGISFSENKELLGRSPFATNKSIAQAENWTKEEVRQRTLELAELAIQRWPRQRPETITGNDLVDDG